LLNLYKDIGYFAQDYRELHSWFWSKRLTAVIRLEKIQLNELAPDFERLMEDKNELVALSAMRALSTLKYPKKATKILEALSRRAPARKDIFIEILTNIGLE